MTFFRIVDDYISNRPWHSIRSSIVCLIISLYSVHLQSQEVISASWIDSLERSYQRSGNIEYKIKLHLLKSQQYQNGDMSYCLKQLDSAAIYLEQIQKSSLNVEYYLRRGRCFQNQNNLSEALNAYLKAEDLAKDDHPLLWDIYHDTGILYDILEVYEKTKEYGVKGQKHARQNEFPDKEIVSIFTVISAAYQLREFKLLKRLAERAIQLQEAHTADYGIYYVHYLLGKTALHEDNADSAIFHFEKGEIVAKADNDADGVSLIHEGLSLAYLKKNELQKAKYYADLALAYEPNYQSDRNLELSEVYAAIGEHQKAFSMLQENVEIKENLKRENNPNSILSTVLNEKFDQEKKLEADKFNAQLEFQRKLSMRNMWLGVLATVIGFFLFLFYYRKRQNRLRNKMLKQQVEEQTKKITEQKKRLEELDKFKSRLYTNITHEFRTPLTVILGMTDQLETGLTSFPVSKSKEKLSFIKRNGKNLLGLINQMLDLSKVENNQLETQFIQGNIVAYVRYISESFHSLANTQNVVLKLDVKQPRISMDYDPEKFRQIASNLLSNAIKYSHSGDKIVIEVDVVDKNLVFSVKDTGIGISEANLPHIFDRFYQADTELAKTGGTGIGLALTKELVSLLGGTISVTSELNKGSVFSVRLPIANKAEKSKLDFNHANDADRDLKPVTSITTNTETRQKESKTARLLVVEDNLDVSEYIGSCLENDYALHFAYNGAAGIEMAFDLIPEIIISDVMMPEKDGFELCETLKNDDRTSHIPIVLLTAKADVSSKIAGLKRGADAYLKKPFHQEELETVLNNLLETRKKLQAKYTQLATQFPNPIQGMDPDAIENAFVTKLREAVEKRLGDASLKADDICKEIGMGRSNLYAKMQSVLGMSFNIYLRTLRLNMAKELLVNSSLNVSEVAYEVGFNDPKYFSRIFSEAFGTSPSKFHS